MSLAFVSLTACGSKDDGASDFDNPEEQPSGAADGTKKSLGDDDGTSGPDLQKCATQTAAAEGRPVHLVFMFDRSGSMIQDGSPKWNASKAATKAFFESEGSKGVSASLSFFPQVQVCSDKAYATPHVKMTTLPSAEFAKALDGQYPDINGDTPSYQAMQGAIAYAQEMAKAGAKDGRVAIVFVTDGMPDSTCGHTAIRDVKELAASVSKTIPTYVIGVGDALSNLNEIAAGGGTDKALMVSPTNAEQIKADFTKAINQIKTSTLSCDYTIPAPPAGSTFDRSKVNILHTPGGGTAATLGYNPSCAGGVGWKYDNDATPTRVLLCDGSCDSVRAKQGKVDILFGCATQVADVR